MFGLEPAALALVAAVTLGGAIVRGLAGFGMAILLVPVAALTMAPAEAVALSNLLGLLIGLTEIRRILASAERTARLIAVVAVATTPLGMIAIASLVPDIARLLLALIATAAFAAVLLPQRPSPPPGLVATGMVGVASGLLNGFAGMPGPPVAPYYLGRRIPPLVARASMMLIFLATSACGVGTGLVLGVASGRTLLLGLVLFPAVLLGNWLGGHAFSRAGPMVWRGFTAAVLAGAAISAGLKVLL